MPRSSSYAQWRGLPSELRRTSCDCKTTPAQTDISYPPGGIFEGGSLGGAVAVEEGCLSSTLRAFVVSIDYNSLLSFPTMKSMINSLEVLQHYDTNCSRRLNDLWRPYGGPHGQPYVVNSWGWRGSLLWWLVCVASTAEMRYWFWCPIEGRGSNALRSNCFSGSSPDGSINHESPAPQRKSSRLADNQYLQSSTQLSNQQFSQYKAAAIAAAKESLLSGLPPRTSVRIPEFDMRIDPPGISAPLHDCDSDTENESSEMSS